MLMTLTLADLRDRYGRGSTRVIKWLVDPYAACGTYLLFIAFVIDQPADAPGLSVACAVVPFQIFILTALAAMRATKERRSLIQELNFQRTLLPVAVTLTETLGFAASLSLLALMMAAYGIAPTVAILWLIPAVAITVLFALATSYPAMLFGVWYPRLIPFAVSGLRVFYFLAPGVVALSEVYGHTHDLIKINPLTGIFEAYRNALLYGQSPPAWELLYPLAVAVALLAVFVPIFRSEQRHLAKVV